MNGFRNILACLVHDNQECVIDLVRNLQHLDPDSVVLLYNGGRDPQLLNHGFPFPRYGAVVHPKPRPLAWGRLHEFALDCMQFAIDNIPFDAMTIVDSDQLGARRDYSHHVAQFFAAHPMVGLAGNSAGVLPRNTRIGPAIAAYKETELWRPFLERFDRGPDKFVHWTFWPSTVFSAAAARDLTRLFATDTQLQDIVSRSQIWASEEILFPTLVSLLGYEVAESPCSYEFVRHRVAYTTRDLERAFTRPSVYWLHPVNRRYGDPLRAHVRRRFNQYETMLREGGPMPAAPDAAPAPEQPLFLTVPILQRMRAIEGWLEDDEADLLIAATQSVARLPQRPVVVEVGSYCGRSTVVLGSVLKAVAPGGRIHAIDPHDGVVGALDQGLRGGPSTLARFETNVAAAGLSEIVVTVQKRSYEVDWQEPISLLFIDGLHDYANVARDFYHFESKVVPGGLIAFHDYADYYPGVKAFVNELLSKTGYERVVCVRSMMLLRKRAGVRRREKRSARALAGTAAKATAADGDPAEALPYIVVEGRPLVSCIMPTRDRRSLAAHAVECFARQDYPARELIVVDDGCVPAASSIRRDPRVQYRRLDLAATIGAKRNLGCELARGEIFVNWDDDDWHAPGRITRQVNALIEGGASMCGLENAPLYEPLSRRAWQPATGELPDGTMAYTRASWRRLRFPDSSDPDLLRRWWRRATTLDGSALYVSLVHHACADPRVVQRARPIECDAVRTLLGRDRAWYDALFPGEAPPSRAQAPPLSEPPSAQPLVSCVMPTFNRPDFVPQAIRCFLRQTYPNKELIVVDDGDERAAAHVPMDPSVRYVSVDRRMPLGAKRNLGVDVSAGDVIAHWDDDDWYAPEYLSRVVARLLQSSSAALTGMSRYLVYLLAAQSLKVCSAGVPAGASFCYWRRIWQDHPYRETERAEDYFFLRDARPAIHAIADAELFAVIRHGRHTWMRDGGGDVDRRFRRLPTYAKTATAVMGASDAAFYETLATAQ
jgi:glycosyltransferase involved in cell wall biosynthesis/predicted O-methyltransferase YrrM